MSIKISHKPGEEREWSEGKFRGEMEYNILGTKDYDTAYAEFFKYIMQNAGYMAGFPLDSIRVKEDEEGGAYFLGTVKYSNRQRRPKDVGIPHYSFSTKGGTAKVTFGRRVVGTYGDDPPDFGTGINFVRDKGFEGVEIIVPKWTKQVKIAYPRQFITYQYESLLRRFTGCFNSLPFLGMAPGECFFNGADCNEGERTDDNGQNLVYVYELTFEFLGMPNVTQHIPGIGMVEKRGWDYVWIYNEEQEDELASRLVSYPKNAYVNQVYDEMDFNVFGF